MKNGLINTPTHPTPTTSELDIGEEGFVVVEARDVGDTPAICLQIAGGCTYQRLEDAQYAAEIFNDNLTWAVVRVRLIAEVA